MKKALTILIGFASTIVVMDMVNYYKIQNGTYKTPWYSQNILHSPYTNFMIYLNRENTRKFITETGRRGYYCITKETIINDIAYWTRTDCAEFGKFSDE